MLFFNFFSISIEKMNKNAISIAQKINIDFKKTKNGWKL